jgi:hypothetical protein
MKMSSERELSSERTVTWQLQLQNITREYCSFSEYEQTILLAIACCFQKVKVLGVQWN